MRHKLKAMLDKLLNNQILPMFLGVAVWDTVFTAMAIFYFQVPSDAILDSSLMEVLRVFEG